MEPFAGLANGFAVLSAPENLFAAVVGCSLGVVGVLPGIGPAGAMAVLLPISFTLKPATAIIVLAGVLAPAWPWLLRSIRHGGRGRSR